MSTSSKKKATLLSLQQRYTILQDLNGGAKQADLATRYNIDAATISRIRKNASDIESKVQSGSINTGIKRIKTTLLDDVDKTLLQWFTNEGHGQSGLSGAMLQEKAKLLGSHLQLSSDVIQRIDIVCNRFFIKQCFEFIQFFRHFSGQIIGQAKIFIRVV